MSRFLSLRCALLSVGLLFSTTMQISFAADTTVPNLSQPVASSTATSSVLPSAEKGLPPPFGANLFLGGSDAERNDGLNESYLIAPGDKIAVQAWGAIALSETVTVDSQGNVFIPEVGPITVGNTPASKLNALVTSKIEAVYPNNVNVYVNLLTATPVSVFVTGPVLRPGQYAGMASDSLLYFLIRAGGIDSERGSYRHIVILRNNNPVLDVDLYEFLRQGFLPNFSFKDQDVILVKPQGSTVTVEGGVRNPFRFEFSTATALGSELTKYARPLAKISHVGVEGSRSSVPFSVYLAYPRFNSFDLEDGDTVTFNADLKPQVIDILIQGSYLGPSTYTVKKDTHLQDLLDHVAIDPALADVQSIYIERASVATKQKEMIDQALQRLERSVYTAPASSEGEARIRTEEAGLVSDFVKRAQQIIPKGTVVVSQNGSVANILLEQRDRVVIPQKSDLVQVGGEVLMPQAVVFNPKAKLEDYIAWAGGYTERADIERIAIVHANGLVDFNQKSTLRPGDQLLVLPKVDAKNMQAVKDITQIIYQIAVAAKIALNF